MDFHFSHVYTLGQIIVQVNNLTCLWVDTISVTENEHVNLQKYVNYLVSKFTQNTYLVVIQFSWRALHLWTVTNWIHTPYLWHYFIIIYIMKVIRILALLQHIFVVFLNYGLQTNDRHILDNNLGSHGWLCKLVLLCIMYLSNNMSCFKMFFIIDRYVGAPGHGTYLVGGMNYGY